MATIAIVYGTGEGQTAKISQYIAAILRQHGHTVMAWDVKQLSTDFVLEQFDAALIGASIHSRRYSVFIRHFVRAHRTYLMRTYSALFTTCLAAAQATAEARAAVQQDVTQFEQESGWIPAQTVSLPERSTTAEQDS
jgi:menaquinone-dependent protoporphyrinogen oxidase